jgi:hypothetical protein
MTETAKTEYKPLERKYVELLRTESAENPLGLVHLRIKKLGFAIPCCRCGGTGIYAGYGVCFRCGGAAFDRVKLTKALYEIVAAAVEAGRLDEYLADVKRKQVLQKADDELFKLMNDSELSRDYSAMYKADRFGKALGLMYKISIKTTESYNSFRKTKTSLNSKKYKEAMQKLAADLGNEWNEAESKRVIDEVLLSKYESTKTEIVTLNEEYEAFKELYLTLFK